jgi:hypothetical protein
MGLRRLTLGEELPNSSPDDHTDRAIFGASDRPQFVADLIVGHEIDARRAPHDLLLFGSSVNPAEIVRHRSKSATHHMSNAETRCGSGLSTHFALQRPRRLHPTSNVSEPRRFGRRARVMVNLCRSAGH